MIRILFGAASPCTVISTFGTIFAPFKRPRRFAYWPSPRWSHKSSRCPSPCNHHRVWFFWPFSQLPQFQPFFDCFGPFCPFLTILAILAIVGHFGDFWQFSPFSPKLSKVLEVRGSKQFFEKNFSFEIC